MNKISGAAIAENTGEVYKTTVTSGDEVFIIDEPESLGGKNEGRSPLDYLCMALASCKAITIRMYAHRKGWKLDKARVNVTFVKEDQLPSGINTFFCSVSLSGDLTDEQLKRILHIAGICPVDRMLQKTGDVITVLE